jgi:hypothetical protein
MTVPKKRPFSYERPGRRLAATTATDARPSSPAAADPQAAFLDFRLVDYVNRLPGHVKIKDGLTKAILRRAVKSLIDRFLAGEPGLEAKVWNLTCFAIWHSGLGSM